MGIDQDIQRLFKKVMSESKNVADGCRKLGVQQGTYAGWAEGWETGHKWSKNKTLFSAIDNAGGILKIPGESDDSLDYDYVEKVAAKAGAGSSLETSGETVGSYAFRKDFLARIGIHARQCIMLDVIGDSMEPMLHAGDTILVDTSQTEVQDGKTYLVAYGEDLHVKHLFKSPGGVILHSENPRYPDVTVSNADMGSLCMVHGRVRWFGRVI